MTVGSGAVMRCGGNARGREKEAAVTVWRPRRDRRVGLTDARASRGRRQVLVTANSTQRRRSLAVLRAWDERGRER